MLKVIGLPKPAARVPEEAPMLTEPTYWPVKIGRASCRERVDVPRPATAPQPLPPAEPKVAAVLLGLVTVLPAAACLVSVRRRVGPAAGLLGCVVRGMWAAGPGTMLKVIGLPKPAARVPEEAPMLTEPTYWPV